MDVTILDRVLNSGIPYITYAIPVFFALIAVEAAVCLVRRRPCYRLHDSISDLACGVADQVVGIFLKSALFGGYLACYGFVTARGLNPIDVNSYGAAGQWIAALALFLGVDLAYYWFHRIAHEWNAPWAGHVVHHSSEEYNLTVALRQGALQSVFSWVFYLPLALLGFPPLWFLAMSAFDTLYQFWIHTRVIGRLGPLERVLNTPSHHRVHHARNPRYLDRNYAGALIIWDRMFGTFQPEDEEPVYGLTKPLNSWNPIWANLHVWADLWRDMWRAPRLADGLRVWVARQGWRPRGLPPAPPAPRVDAATAVRYDVRPGRAMTTYVVVQFILTLAFAVVVLLVAADPPHGDRLLPAVVFILWSLSNVAGLTEGRRWAVPSEVVRMTFVAALAATSFIGPPASAATPQSVPQAPIVAPVITAPAGSATAEQTGEATRPAAERVASFDGLGAGFAGPQGSAALRNPSDNSLAVGPDHIVQTVNSRMAIFTKRGRRFAETGRALYGPVNTNNVFRGFGGMCESTNNGDAVVRYDQVARRWLIVMPIFRRAAARPDQPPVWTARDEAYLSPPGRPGQPGPAMPLYQPPAPIPAPAASAARAAPSGGGAQAGPPPQGPYSMCYAISTGPDPFGPYYRYEFLRPLFPDYPRPAIWRDGYYVPTSTGDDPVSDTIATQKHACVVDRARMLAGQPAAEQCVVLNNVGFLNNADIDGEALPPPGAPNVMLAAGGVQLLKQFEADTIEAWRFHVDWKNPARTRVSGLQKVAVAPFRYLCDGQLTNCVPQPGTDRRLDGQGDKIMSRLVYRRIGSRETLVAVHSVNTTMGGGGVRWYELRVGAARFLELVQQGTFAPDGFFRWLPSPAIDRAGNIGIGYSFGGAAHFAGQRFAARLAGDPPGRLTLAEAVLAEGEAAQQAMRWEDYTQTAMDPSDDCTIWYVGDYLKRDAAAYSTRIGAFRLPGCGR